MHRVALTALALSTTALAQDTTFIRFASVGQTYSAAIFGGDPRIGRQVISATITLHLTVSPGSDAAEFVTDLLVPTDSNTAAIVITGADEHWSGSGTFDIVRTTADLNGMFIARRYGAETFGVQGSISEDSGITLTFASACAADFNQDGTLDLFDYLDFTQAFASGDVSADFNSDQVVDFFDYLDFVQAFGSGC